MKSPDDILTPKEVETDYRIVVGTQKTLRARRQIPYFALGGGRLIRYRRSELEAWLASKRVA